MTDLSAITVKISLAWWVVPAVKCTIVYWLLRRVLTGRDPTDQEVTAVAERLAQRGTRLQVPV